MPCLFYMVGDNTLTCCVCSNYNSERSHMYDH